MRLDDTRLTEVLTDAWRRWATRCAELTEAQWHTPTRCTPWDVKALAVHACPGDLFDQLVGTDEAVAITDAADLLRLFNRPDGVASSMAEDIAAAAVSEGSRLTAEEIVRRFTAAAHTVAGVPLTRAVRYPVAGVTTLRVIAEVAVMEATVHLLDLGDAVGGVAPSAEAIAATRDLLIAIPDPTAAVEVLAGRAAASTVLPVVR